MDKFIIHKPRIRRFINSDTDSMKERYYHDQNMPSLQTTEKQMQTQSIEDFESHEISSVKHYLFVDFILITPL